MTLFEINGEMVPFCCEECGCDTIVEVDGNVVARRRLTLVGDDGKPEDWDDAEYASGWEEDFNPDYYCAECGVMLDLEEVVEDAEKMKAMTLGPIVEEITALIVNHQDDERLHWDGDDRVRIAVNRIIPKGSAAGMTLESRRKRFRDALKGAVGAGRVGRDRKEHLYSPIARWNWPATNPNTRYGKMKIFTKRFFQLSHRDQAAIVDSVIHDLESAHFHDQDGERKAKQLVKRIVRKTIKYGVYAAFSKKKG